MTPLAASQLGITQQPPSSVTAGSGFGLQAAIEDSYGNVETGDDSTAVTTALANNPTGATLGGTLSTTVTRGVATFSGLTLTAGRFRLHARRLQQRYVRRDDQRHHRDPAAATQLVITQQPPSSVVVNSRFRSPGRRRGRLRQRGDRTPATR